ncbi:hypothetical protein [Streptomyces sp. Je 1-332]|uniref:hypothetical protein n=1 Tax=Streptomyces sp. Je 1-332 TaxID=3231270 RepID=UPI00345A969F
MDRHAHALSRTGDEAARHYERALDALLFFRAEVADEAQAMAAASPHSVMAHVFDAYLGLLGTEEQEAADARRSFGAFRSTVDPAGLSPRERMHAAAAQTWLDGNMSRAGEILGEISTEYPPRRPRPGRRTPDRLLHRGRSAAARPDRWRAFRVGR